MMLAMADGSAGSGTRSTPVIVAGAGIVGLWQALVLARAGFAVTLMEASHQPFAASASQWAGAMLAPDCEAESAPPVVRTMGHRAVAMWREVYPDLVNAGTLVVAGARDNSELDRFSRMTTGGTFVSGDGLASLEPELAPRLSRALYYRDEAHMNANAAMRYLLAQCEAAGVIVKLGTPWDGLARPDARVIDARGFAARGDLATLRGVRGERVLVDAADVSITRPVRLLHPRQPIYIVPQGHNRYVIGATLIEREDAGPMTVRSALDLLGSAYALHPGFAEASIIDMGAGVRPAFPDNVPRIAVSDGGAIVRVNGAYRHGFLLAPVLAEAVLGYLQTREEPAAFAL